MDEPAAHVIDDADLRRRIGAALEYAARALDLLTDPPDGLDLHALEAPADKIAAEAAILLREVAAVPDAALASEAHRLALRLEPFAHSPRIIAAMAVRPSVARDLGAPHVLLASLGLGDARTAEALARSLASPVAGVRERLPHRALEQDWLDAVRRGDIADERWVAETPLVRGLDLPSANRDDLYALTHAVAYATDFGRWSVPAVVDPTQTVACAESALAAVLDADDFDLAAELLMTWPCLGIPMSATARFAFDVLRRVEDEAGVLPSLSLSTREAERQPAERRAQYVTAVTYHTAFVMGLLCAVLLRCATDGPRPMAQATTYHGAAHLLADLASGGRRRQWMVDAAAHPVSELAALTPYLMDVALLRAVRAMELGQARDLLLETVGRGVTGTMLALQVADTLSRLAASDRMLADTPD